MVLKCRFGSQAGEPQKEKAFNLFIGRDAFIDKAPV